MEKVYLVCNAHLDPVWLWEWEEGAAETLSTFRTAAEFCEEMEGFVFNHNEALLYQWIEEYDPSLFSRIQSLVKQRKWHVIGGWYLQPDCVMLSGESFARQILVGRKYFEEKFGAHPTTAINFDSFGHSKGLVQTLVKSGYDSYVICRAGAATQKMKRNDFTWKGLDDSRITVHLSDENYNSVKGHVAEELAQWIEKHKEETTGLFLWGVGDHGGGPSRYDLETLKEMIKTRRDGEIVHATPEEYFADLNQSSLELYEESLNPVSPGCYTSQIRIKQKHRKLENGIYMAEKMLTQAAIRGLLPYPKDQLAEAQIDLMRAQFHDALPGSAIPAVEEATLDQLGHGLEIVSRLKARAFFALSAGQRRVTQGETPILVYNPHPFPIETTVDCEMVLPEQNWEHNYFVPVVYQDEKKLPCQVEKQASSFEIDWRKRAVFAATLPPASMSRFDCRFVREAEKPSVRMKEENGIIRFEGARVSASINCKTGWMDSLVIDGISCLKAAAFRAVVLEDGYSPWRVGYKGFDAIAGEFQLMTPADGSAYSALPDLNTPSVRITEDGEVRTVVEAVFRYNHSTLLLRYLLPKIGREIGLEATLLWQEKDKILKLCVPTPFSDYIGQTAFGREMLFTDGEEAVSHKWSAAVSDENAFACINNGLHGSNFKNGEMRISLVRSPAYSMADFDGLIAQKPGITIPRMDQGERHYQLWFTGGERDSLLSCIDNLALSYNERPMALSSCPSGEGVLCAPCITIDNSQIVLSAMKLAEDEKGYILRLFEASGTAASCTLEIGGVRKMLQFAPFEIKTLRLKPENSDLCETGFLEK